MASLWNTFTSFFSGKKSNVPQEKKRNKNSDDSQSQPDYCNAEKPVCSKHLADAVKEKSTLLEPQTGPLPVYKVCLKGKKINVDGCKLFTFGKETTKRNRTIMVLGATGAGKTTLINGMINYILGVEWGDSYRFKLVDEGQSKSQAESQTSEVTVYKIHHEEGFKIDYSLTIVDTPGFGDTRGIERDRMIVQQLRNLFTAELGVSEIDAVCFVAQAALARLTPTQKYVFDSVLAIFGKDVAENIRILVTFADGQRPPVLEAITASGVPCPKAKDGLPVHFKFNNSALFAHNTSSAGDSLSGDDEDENFDQMFWNMGKKSMKRFFAALNVIKTKSLTLTKEVLRERQQLENSVEKLQVQVKVGLAKLEEIKETREILKENEAEISRNENFEFEVTVTKPVQENISGSGNYITNCQQCHFTCHYPCGIPNDNDKRGCASMGPDGYCTDCPGKCYWNIHFNQKYKWEYKDVKEKTTVKELKEKYLKATEEQKPVQALIKKLKTEYDQVQAEVVKLIKRSANCLNRLKEIALKPNPLSTPEYIDMLIEGEKQEAKPGWKQRVQSLLNMREKAETMAKVDRGEVLLQSPSTGFQNCNKDELSEGQGLTNAEKIQGEAKADITETNNTADTNKNLDKTDTKTNKDQDNKNTDQGIIETNTNQDQDQSVGQTDTNETHNNSANDPNQDDDDTNKNKEQDHADIYTDNCKNEEITETDTGKNQDETKTSKNRDQHESESDTGSDQEGNISSTDTDSNTQDHNKTECDIKTDQDKTDSKIQRDKPKTVLIQL